MQLSKILLNSWTASFCAITSVISFITIIISLLSLSKLNDEKIHGVHETDFIFNGNYIIVTKTNDNEKLYYSSNCEAITEFGNCFYITPYKTNIYEDAISYCEEFCIVNTTMHGYISTEKDKCMINYPNKKLHNKLITLYVMSSYLGFVICTIMLGSVISDFIKKRKQMQEEINRENKRKEEIRNQEQRVLLESLIEKVLIQEATIKEKIIREEMSKNGELSNV